MNAIALGVSPAVVSRYAADAGHAGHKGKQRQRPPPVLAPPGVGGVERWRIETGRVPPDSVPSPHLEERSVLGAVVKRLVNPHTPGRHGPMCIHGSTWLGGRCWKCPSDAEWARQNAEETQQLQQEEQPGRPAIAAPESTDLAQPETPSTPIIGGAERYAPPVAIKAETERECDMQSQRGPPLLECDV
jgi:hypothetical protein